MNDTGDWMDQVFRLPEGERAALAHRLLLSLEPDAPDPDYEALWAEEIERRLRALDEGKTSLSPWNEAAGRIRKNISRESSI